jgi:hypothetical protein
METKTDHTEKLNLIYEMIENSKTNLSSSAFFYLLWGWLVLVASLTHFFLMKVHVDYSYLVWPAMMIAGMIASTVKGIRLGKQTKVWTHIDTALVYLWWGFFFTIVVFLAFAIAGRMSWNVTDALIISLYGLGTFVSGGILKFRPLIIGGICSWVIALFAFWVREEYVLLLIAASVIIAYLIPGYMLKYRH